MLQPHGQLRMRAYGYAQKEAVRGVRRTGPSHTDITRNTACMRQPLKTFTTRAWPRADRTPRNAQRAERKTQDTHRFSLKGVWSVDIQFIAVFIFFTVRFIFTPSIMECNCVWA
jgi:hypothetical protein